MIAELHEDDHADAIGMSGLLVKSTVIMREDLVHALNEKRRERPPVILGGAALNRRYVEQDLTGDLPGPALLRRGRLRRACASWTSSRPDKKHGKRRVARPIRQAREAGQSADRPNCRHRVAGDGMASRRTRSPACGLPRPRRRGEYRRRSRTACRKPAPDLPTPPFVGSRRCVKDFNVEEVFRVRQRAHVVQQPVAVHQGQRSKPADYERLMQRNRPSRPWRGSRPNCAWPRTSCAPRPCAASTPRPPRRATDVVLFYADGPHDGAAPLRLPAAGRSADRTLPGGLFGTPRGRWRGSRR